MIWLEDVFMNVYHRLRSEEEISELWLPSKQKQIHSVLRYQYTGIMMQQDNHQSAKFVISLFEIDRDYPEFSNMTYEKFTEIILEKSPL